MNRKTTNKFRSLSATLIIALVAQLFLQAPVCAQTDQGRIIGTVRDQSKAIVPGATVTVKNDRTGEERNINTTDQGQYLVTALKPRVLHRQRQGGWIRNGAIYQCPSVCRSGADTRHRA